MALDSWLAAIGGGLEGVQATREKDKDREIANRKIDTQQSLAELRAMLEQLKEGGRNARTDKVEAGKSERAEGRDETTRYGIDTRAGTQDTISQRRDATTRRGQDINDDHYWDNNNLNWSRLMMGDATARRGQDVSSSTARRGQDMTQGTAQRGQDLNYDAREDAIDSTGDTRAMGYAMQGYKNELQRRKQGSTLFGDTTDQLPTFEDWLKTSDDPEIFPSVKKMFSSGGGVAPAVDSGGSPPAALPGARAVTPRPRRPVAPAAGALEEQARGLVDQIRSLEAAGKDATAQREQLRALRAQVPK